MKHTYLLLTTLTTHTHTRASCNYLLSEGYADTSLASPPPKKESVYIKFIQGVSMM